MVFLHIEVVMSTLIPPSSDTAGKGISPFSVKIGPLPWPVYAVLAAIVYGASVTGKLPADMTGGIAVMMCMGLLLAEIGSRTPVLKNIGGPAILCMFVPSVMVYYHLVNDASLKAVSSFMKDANFLYFYIACLVVGSLLGMARQILIQGFLRMFVPLLAGTLASLAMGTLVGTLMGMKPYNAFFYVVVPILSGGMGEGLLPLSASYAAIQHTTPDKFLPHMAPAVMMGNVCAIVIAGFLKRLGEKKPEYSGGGLLVKTGHDDLLRAAQTEEKPIEFALMGAGLLMACTAYAFGLLMSPILKIPAPIIMIFSAALLKVLGVLPEPMERGAYHIYKFVSANLTWALVVGVGALLTPWGDVVSALSFAYLCTVIATVATMIASGFFVGKLMNMYPIEAALVTACHSGMGGTGDVAILSSASRMEMMPFAQISTRIGGACMVVAAAILMRFLG